MADKRTIIHVENLNKSFGKLEVLKDISMDISEGECPIQSVPQKLFSVD